MSLVRKRAAMTLVEIMFTFAIISTVLTLSYAAALNAWRNAVSANQRTQAQYLVQQGIESVRAYRESAGFRWGGTDGFVSKLPSIGGDGFHMAMSVDGVESASSYACPTGSTCEFIVKSGGASLPAVGAAGEGGSITDSTVYTLTIQPTNYFVENADTPVNAPGTIPTTPPPTAVSLTATIRWQGANGIDSNAVASTIITRP